MDDKTKNIAASVHQRLLNKSRESSRPFNENAAPKGAHDLHPFIYEG